MFRIITIPFDRKTECFDDSLLNQWTLNKQVKNCRAEFFKDGEEAYWTVFIEYDPVLENVPVEKTDGLDGPQKVLFDRLREWRRERGEKDGVPVYIIGTNRELRDIILQKPKSLEALRTVKGFGKQKVSRYGEEIVAIIKAFYEGS
jgi:superfamily II DNA helicase RecQ